MPTILITGGSRGIGAATARLCAAAGHAVCVNYRDNEAAAQAVVAEVEKAGANCGAWFKAAVPPGFSLTGLG